ISKIADLVAIGNSNNGVSFGFGAFTASTPSSPSLSSLLPEETDHLNSELKILIKRLAKKDTLTKIKATDDLKSYLATAEVDELAKFVYLWPKIFNKSALDVERKIRENFVACQAIMFTRLKKEMAPVLKQLIGTWLCLMFDNSSTEVAKLATESFQKAFPSKQADVLTFCQSEICNFVSDNILYHTAESLSDARYSTPEEMQSKYVRIVSGSFAIISFLYENVSNMSALNETFESIFANSKFWDCAKSARPQIRRSVYLLVRTLALLENESPLRIHLNSVKLSFLNECFADNQAVTHDALWDAVLTLTQKYPTETWYPEDLKIKKGAPAKLFKYLENGCYGSGPGSWPALLAFLSSLPNNFASLSEFREKFFESFWAGLSSLNVTPINSKVFVSSIQECCLFLTLKYGYQCLFFYLSVLKEFIFSDSRFSVASDEVDFVKIAPVTIGHLYEALLFPVKNADARFKLNKGDLEVAVSGFISKICATSSIPSNYSKKLATSFCDNISSCFDVFKPCNGLVELSEEEIELFCARAVGIIIRFEISAINSSFLKEKLGLLVEQMLLKSLNHISSNDRILKKNGIAVFTSLSFNLKTSVVPSVLKISAAIESFVENSISQSLSNDPDYISLIGSILVWLWSDSSENHRENFIQLIVDSNSLDAVREYLSKARFLKLERVVSSYLDMFVIQLAENSEGFDVIAQSLVVDSTRLISEETTSKICGILNTSLDSYLRAGSQNGRIAENCAFALDLLNLLFALSPESVSSLPQYAPLMMNVLEVAFFQSLADIGTNISKSALELWNSISKDKKTVKSDSNTLLELSLSSWKANLLNRHSFRASDFVEIYSRLQEYYSENVIIQKSTIDKILIDLEIWNDLKAPFMGTRNTIAILDRSYLVSEDSEIFSLQPIEISIGSSIYARVAAVLSEIFEAFDVDVNGNSSKKLHDNVFELLLFHVALSDLRDDGKDCRLPFGDPSARIIKVVKKFLNHSIEETWITDAISFSRGAERKKIWADDFLFDCFDISLRKKSIFEWRVFAKMFWLTMKKAKGVEKLGILGFINALFDSGRYYMASSVCYEIKKFLNVSSSDPFIVSLAKTSSISKLELQTVDSVEKSSAALCILTSLLSTTKDFSPSISLKNIVKQFRVWFMAGNNIKVTEVPVLLRVRVLEYLVCVIEMGLDFEISVAGFVVELTKALLEDSSSRVILYNAIALYEAIKAADEETWTTIERFESSIQELLLEKFISENTSSDMHLTSKSRGTLQSRLAYICREIEFGILFKRLPCDEFARILFTNNVETQIVVYKLLSKIIIKLVESISVRLEMSVSHGDEVTEKFINNILVDAIAKNLPFLDPNHLVEDKVCM
ncbi:hypothetical protein HK100_004241, partial [Physocladia obscura]